MLKKLVIVLIVIMAVMLGSALVCRFRRRDVYVEVDQATRQTYINMLNSEVQNSQYSETKQEMRALLNKELGLGIYIYNEGDANYSSAVFRYIEVQKTLGVEEYCFILCHEMCHVKYFSANEIYTQFMTFKTLYESNNPTLKRVGTWFGIYVLNGCYSTGYDCSAMIVDYLKG